MSVAERDVLDDRVGVLLRPCRLLRLPEDRRPVGSGLLDMAEGAVIHGKGPTIL